MTCPKPSSPYELAGKGLAEKGCPDGKTPDQDTAYATVTSTDAKTLTNPKPKTIVMCFALNIVPGECYREANGYFAHSPDCQSSAKRFRVVSQTPDPDGPLRPGPHSLHVPHPGTHHLSRAGQLASADVEYA